MAGESGKVPLKALTNLERTSRGVHGRQELHIHNLKNVKRNMGTVKGEEEQYRRE